MKLLNKGKLCTPLFKLKDNIFSKSSKQTETYTIKECEFQKSIRGNSVIYDNTHDVRYTRFAIKSFNTTFNALKRFNQISITNIEFEQIRDFINSNEFDITKRYDITFELATFRSTMLIMFSESSNQPIKIKEEPVKENNIKDVIKIESVKTKPIDDGLDWIESVKAESVKPKVVSKVNFGTVDEIGFKNASSNPNNKPLFKFND